MVCYVILRLPCCQCTTRKIFIRTEDGKKEAIDEDGNVIEGGVEEVEEVRDN